MPRYFSQTLQNTAVTALAWVPLPRDSTIPSGSFNITAAKTLVSGHGDCNMRIEATMDDPASFSNIFTLAVIATPSPTSAIGINLHARAVRLNMALISGASSDYNFALLVI